jgi:hypothetical protein
MHWFGSFLKTWEFIFNPWHRGRACLNIHFVISIGMLLLKMMPFAHLWNLQLFPTFITIIALFCTRRLLEIGSFKFLDHNFYCIHFASSCIWGYSMNHFLTCFKLQIPHLRPAEYKRSRLPRNRRTVNRPYGGVLSGTAVRERWQLFSHLICSICCIDWCWTKPSYWAGSFGHFWLRSRRLWRRCWRSKRPRTRPPRARHSCQ